MLVMRMVPVLHSESWLVMFDQTVVLVQLQMYNVMLAEVSIAAVQSVQCYAGTGPDIGTITHTKRLCASNSLWTDGHQQHPEQPTCLLDSIPQRP